MGECVICLYGTKEAREPLLYQYERVSPLLAPGFFMRTHPRTHTCIIHARGRL